MVPSSNQSQASRALPYSSRALSLSRAAAPSEAPSEAEGAAAMSFVTGGGLSTGASFPAPPKVTSATAATARVSAARASHRFRGFWAMRLIRSVMVRFPAVMVVEARRRSAGEVWGMTMDTRVWP